MSQIFLLIFWFLVSTFYSLFTGSDHGRQDQLRQQEDGEAPQVVREPQFNPADDICAHFHLSLHDFNLRVF